MMMIIITLIITKLIIIITKPISSQNKKKICIYEELNPYTKYIKFILMSQLAPWKPAAQVQVYALSLSSQVLPLLHGLLAHSSTSVKSQYPVSTIFIEDDAHVSFFSL